LAIIGAFTNGYITVNGVDLSDHMTACSVESTRDLNDVTAMGATSKVQAVALGDAKITATFLADYAAGKVDATLQPLSVTQTPFTVEVRPVNGGRSATNPGYTLSAILPNYNPISGSVGDAVKVDVEFTNASQTGLSRLTA
jgi:hypothetical protein